MKLERRRPVLREIFAGVPAGVNVKFIGHVAGGEYLLPVADRIETTAGKTLFRNDSVYSNYRKFVAESTLKADTESEVP